MTPIPVGPPLFTAEGPEFYDRAFTHNSPFASAGPYQTTLTGPQETAFRAWVTAMNVPFDPDEDPTDYDMRGFYKASEIDHTIPSWTGLPAHFPDTFKTPYDTSFSKQSNYATAACPFDWISGTKWGDLLIDLRNGQIVFGPPGAGLNGSSSGGAASDKLQPSRLSDQLEALGSDIDLTDLTLALKARDPLPVIEMVTDGQISRTIEGASTLSLTLHDRDQKIRRSALLVEKTSVKIDGLWFRLTGVEAQGNDIRLAFEDREVAVLRSWPPRDRPDLWARVNTPESLGPPGVARARFAERLIKDVKGELAIRFVCPVLDNAPPIRTTRDRKTPAQKRQKHEPGLSPNAKITVKGAPATPAQVIDTDRVLDVGYSMRVDSILLVAAVMVINQESEAGRRQLGYEGSCSNNGRAIGIFQQCPGGGRPDGGGSWPATYDVEAEAHAFFEVAQWIQDKALKGEYGDSPGSISIDTANVASFCSEIQRNSTWGTPRQGEPYAKSLGEALKTVALYLGTDEGDIDEPGTDLPPRKAPKPPLILDDGTDDTARMFYRGKRTTRNGRKVWQREDNWDCLGRLAEEIRWRRFCVSGTVYFISEPDLFGSAAAKYVPYSPGVDAIDGRYDVGQHNAAVTVKCRADRWAAPPGTVVELDETGLFDGRWIVATISRSLFNAAATITLKKPRPALPESQAPEYGKGEGSGTIRPPKKKTKPPLPPPGPPGTISDYLDPFRDVTSLYAARIDMGVDYAAADADPIYAIGPGRIDYISRVWLGDPRWSCVGYTFTEGPAEGLSVFVAEYITFGPGLGVGGEVNSSSVIANFVPGTSFRGNGIETGWATPGTGSPRALGIYPGGGRMTAFGADFSYFLSLLNIRNAGRAEHPPPIGSLPAGWPRWKKG